MGLHGLEQGYLYLYLTLPYHKSQWAFGPPVANSGHSACRWDAAGYIGVHITKYHRGLLSDWPLGPHGPFVVYFLRQPFKKNGL
jgi:hypothetical protein